MHGHIYRFVSCLHPIEANVPGYGQFSETTTRPLENQSNSGFMPE
jgi:hypothetical protein